MSETTYGAASAYLNRPLRSEPQARREQQRAMTVAIEARKLAPNLFWKNASWAQMREACTVVAQAQANVDKAFRQARLKARNDANFTLQA